MKSGRSNLIERELSNLSSCLSSPPAWDHSISRTSRLRAALGRGKMYVLKTGEILMHRPTPQMTKADAATNAQALVSRLHATEPSSDAISGDLAALDSGEPVWRNDLMRLLQVANGIPLNALLDALNVGPAVVMARRRKDRVLDQAVKDYLGAYFEDEAQLPEKDIKGNVLLAALEAHAHGWKSEETRSLTDEDLQKIIRAIVDSVRLRVSDPKILKLIGEDIQETLKRFQGE